MGLPQVWVPDQGLQVISLPGLSLVASPTSVSLTRNEASTSFGGLTKELLV